MQPYTICLTGGVARNPLVRLAAPASASFPADEHIAIVGPNGSGKSLLVDMLIGKYPLKEGTITYDFSPSTSKTVYENIKYIAFRDTYGSADANYYYQQRWNTHDHDDVPLVRDMLGEVRDEKLKEEEKLAIILGTEGEGLMPQTIEQSDYTIKIPMAHGVDSLNVAAASAVAFWELGNKEVKR